MVSDKVNILKRAINRQLEIVNFTSTSNISIPLHFILDNVDGENAFNFVSVSSLEEAQEIVDEIITEENQGINIKVNSYNRPLFLSVTVSF